MRRVGVLVISFIVAFGVIGNALMAPVADAGLVDPGWLDGGSVQYKDLGSTSPYPKRCQTEYRKISPIMGHVYTTFDPTPDIQVCVYKNKGFQYAAYEREFYIDPSWKSFGTRYESSIAFAAGDTDMMTPASVQIDASTLDRTYTGVDSDIFIRQERGANYALTLMLYHNPLSHMEKDNYGWLYFSGDADYSLKTIQGDTINYASALGAQVSPNNKFLVFAAENAGYGYIDLDTFNGRLFSNSFKISPDTWPIPVPTLAISSDAKYAVVGGSAVATRIYGIKDSCGMDFNADIDIYKITKINECDYRDLTEETYSHSRAVGWYGYRYFLDVHISNSGDSFSYYDYDKWSTIYAPNYLPPESMDYIALGDSYSSGEGDFYHPEGSHYLPFTNVLGNYKDGIPRELCHVSDRSYPFLLANDMGVTRGKDMQSVACSGAVRGDVLSDISSDGLSAGYLGQSTPIEDSVVLPRLQLLSDSKGLQQGAQTNFIPGRVQQVDFIKQYHPKVATIGISGNDIGFAQILQACLFNSPLETCDYATPTGLKDVANILQDNYAKQVAFYTKLKQASPGTDFYAVGYPQFISDDKIMCWSLGGALNQQERSMITASVTYLNKTIRNAASTAGIKYINIENALNGNQMCGEGSGGVSHPLIKAFYGALTLDLFDFADKDTVVNSLTPAEDYIYQQLGTPYRDSSENLVNNPMTAGLIAATETFHPNATGHQLIYQYIHNHQNGISLLDDTCDGTVIVCPSTDNSGLPALLPTFGATHSLHTQIGSLAWVASGGTATDGELGIGATVERGSQIQIRDSSIATQLPSAVAAAKLTLHSDAVNLGTVQVVNGAIVPATLQIPSDTQPGFHQLVLDVTYTDGSTSKFIQPLFITGPQDDIDGDGIKNNVDTCEFITPSGKDVDGDGIDDNCDAWQGHEKTLATTTTSSGQSSNAKLLPSSSFTLAMTAPSSSDNPLLAGQGEAGNRGEGTIIIPSSNNQTSKPESNDKLGHNWMAYIMSVCLFGIVALVVVRFCKRKRED